MEEMSKHWKVIQKQTLEDRAPGTIKHEQHQIEMGSRDPAPSCQIQSGLSTYLSVTARAEHHDHLVRVDVRRCVCIFSFLDLIFAHHPG